MRDLKLDPEKVNVCGGAMPWAILSALQERDSGHLDPCFAPRAERVGSCLVSARGRMGIAVVSSRALTRSGAIAITGRFANIAEFSLRTEPGCQLHQGFIASVRGCQLHAAGSAGKNAHGALPPG